MRSKIILALVLCLGIGVAPAQLASPFSQSVWPAQTFTSSNQTGTVIQLNGLSVTSTVGSSFASGTLTVTGTSLTTVTFALQGSSDNGATFYALPIYTVASPTSTPTTTVTATGNGIYQVSLAGITHVRIVTSGTFTATNVSFVFTSSPNAGVAKNGSSSGGNVSGQASGVIPLGSTATSIGAQSHCDDGNTTSGTVTCNEPMASPGYQSTSPYNGFGDYKATGTVNPTVEAANTERWEAPNSIATPFKVILPNAPPSGGNNYLFCTSTNPSICSWAAGGGGGSSFSIANNGYFHGSGTPATSAALGTFSSSLTAGSLIIVHQYSAAAGSYSAPTDTASNTYLDCGPGAGSFNSGGDNFECWYALNTHTTASNVVTVHSSSAAFLSGAAFEILGAAASSPIDGGSGAGYSILQNAAGGAAGSNNLSATALTPTGNGDLIVAFFAAGNGATAGTSPNAFTLVNAGWVQSSEYFTQTTSAAITATASDSASSDPYGAVVVAIKP